MNKLLVGKHSLRSSLSFIVRQQQHVGSLSTTTNPASSSAQKIFLSKHNDNIVKQQASTSKSGTGNRFRMIHTSGLFQQQETTTATASTESEAKIVDIEKRVEGTTEKHEFLAETKQLLNIVAHSLYSEKEVFIRELISNASDAIEKLKYAQLSAADTLSKEAEIGGAQQLKIDINANDIANTLTIADTGFGMTKAELVENLGTIAHSGSKKFLEKLKESSGAGGGAKGGADGIIGQFGVGFYSAFMVADRVEVFSRSAQAGSKAYVWSSTGDGAYEICEVESPSPETGTKIVMHLKPECAEFSKEATIKTVVNKYSNFVGHPIVINGDRVNLIQPIWTENASNVTEEQHEEFYKFMGNFDKPRYTMQYKTDAPINIRALFYVPSFKPSPGDINQEGDCGVALYSKKVLILSKANQILPRWLRFLKGVVDSEDIPLNLSRELLQDSNLIQKLRRILTGRILRFLNEQSNEDPEKFNTFYDDFNLYFKEAIMREVGQNEKEEIASLLRFETTSTEPGQKVSLAEYIARMKEDQKDIYFFAAPSRQLALASPYFEAMKQKNDCEIVFLFEPYDEMVVMQLGEYKRKKLVGIEQESQTKNESGDKSKKSEEDDVILEGDKTSLLTNDEALELKNWFSGTLGTKVKKVKITKKLDTHPCVVTTDNMGMVRHLIKSNYFQREKINDFYGAINLTLEFNPRNPLIKAIYTLQKEDPPLAQMLTEQLLDNCMVSAGLIEDPRLVLSNLNQLLEKAFAPKAKKIIT